MNTIKTFLLFALLVLLMSYQSEKPKTVTITRSFDEMYLVNQFITKDVNKQGYHVVCILPYKKANDSGKEITSFYVVAEK